MRPQTIPHPVKPFADLQAFPNMIGSTGHAQPPCWLLMFGTPGV
jgi:hypothetical protein